MSKSLEIKKLKKHNSFNVSMTLTEGKILTLQSALQIYAGQSEIAGELLEYLKRAMIDVGIVPHNFQQTTVELTDEQQEKEIEYLLDNENVQSQEM